MDKNFNIASKSSSRNCHLVAAKLNTYLIGWLKQNIRVYESKYVTESTARNKLVSVDATLASKSLSRKCHLAAAKLNTYSIGWLKQNTRVYESKHVSKSTAWNELFSVDATLASKSLTRDCHLAAVKFNTYLIGWLNQNTRVYESKHFSESTTSNEQPLVDVNSNLAAKPSNQFR